MKSDTSKNLKTSLSSQLTKEIHSNEFFYKHIAELTPDAVVIHSGGKILYANPAAVKLVQATNTGELVGKPLMKFIHKDSIPLIQERIKKMLSQGKVAPFVEEKFVTVKGTIIYVETKAVPFTFQGKKAILAIIRNITARKKNEEKQNFLNEVSMILGSSVSLPKTLTTICKLLVPHLADYIRIALINDDNDIEEVATYHRDHQKIALVKKLYKTYNGRSDVTHGVSQVIQKGKSEIMEMVTPQSAAFLKKNKEVGEIIEELELVSYMGVPLKVNNKVVGVITFSSSSKERIYTEEDLKFAEEVAIRIAYAVENAKLFSNLQQEFKEKAKAQEAHARLISYLDQTFDAILLWEYRGSIVYWNKGAEEVYGYTKEEAIGKISHSLLKTIHPVPFSEIEKTLIKAGRWEGELIHTTKQNKTIIVSCKKVLFNGDNGKKYILETNRDITKQRSDQFGQARLAAIVNSSDDAIISKNLDSVIQTWNQAAEKMFGYTAEEAIGKKIYIIIPKERYSEEEKIITLLKHGKRITHFQTVRKTKNGRKVDVSLSISPIFDDKGHVVGASKIARDTTEEVRLQNNLRFFSEASKLLSSSLDYRTTLANITALAVPHIADWCVVDMKTEKGIEQLAVAHVDPKKVKWAEELRRKNPPDPDAKTGVPQILRTGKVEYYYEITDQMLVAGAKDEEQLKLLRKLKFSSVIIVPIRVKDETVGAITFVSAESGHHYTKTDLAIAEELSARAGLAVESALLYSQSQQAIKVRDEFISLASHELKTPLASIKMYGQILNKQLEKRGDTSLTNFLEKMDQQTDRLTLLVNDLLNVSKIQHGKLEYNFERVDLNVLVHDIVDVMRRVSLKHTIFVDGEIKKPVQADPFRTYQVLTNLLTNAIKYSPDADKILVLLSSDKKFVKITVQDFGIGIAPDHQEKIFDQFYRVIDPNERKFSGLGMGLFISHEIIQRHGGTMSVKSAKGKGSQFSFTLPSVARGL